MTHLNSPHSMSSMQEIRNPANTAHCLGTIYSATPEQVQQAITLAATAQPAWSATSVQERAAVLQRMADLLQQHMTELMSLLIQEAGKTRADALSEVREAIDFCRYYAEQAYALMAEQVLPGPTGERNSLQLHARGLFACISPWNFPLAIFLGQIAAALVTGNGVLAKPAPQTPLIAQRTMALLQAAGLPPPVAALLLGGPAVGEQLIRDPRIVGIAFTGSTATAKHIARAVLDDAQRPLVTLIAETGGINAMIVDSTALPEQVVADVIASAFQSAGQRCSALRLLCLQADIYDTTLRMLTGAMAELQIGDPMQETTDIGPVIDAAARDRIVKYLDAQASRIHYQLPLPANTQQGWFVAPTIIALNTVQELQQEIFGPVLHVVKWQADKLNELLDAINASGYGLTMGVHSRLDSTIQRVRERARVGNLYVNRSMIGAVVGSQPFGGESLSGTGPKAGGPHYLLRFCTERTVSIDTTAAGGNASLLTLD